MDFWIKKFAEFDLRVYVYNKLEWADEDKTIIKKVENEYDHIRISHPTEDLDIAEIYVDEHFYYEGEYGGAKLARLLAEFRVWAQKNILS